MKRTDALKLAESLMTEAESQMDKAEKHQFQSSHLADCYFTAGLVLKSICTAVRKTAEGLPTE